MNVDEAEFNVTFFDINGDTATILVWKMGGGTVGNSYEGSWKVSVDGVYGATGVMDMRSGTERNHFEVAMIAYDYYLQDREV